MSAQDSSTHSSLPGTGARRSRRSWIIAGVAIGALGFLSSAGALVYARDGGGWRHGHGGPMNAERFAHHIEHIVKFVLSEVDATAEQKAQVTAILQSAAADMRPLADEHFAAHEELHQILSAQTIDRTRLEALRVDGLRLADDASRRIVQSMADAAEVLTPEQRAALSEKIERHRHWRNSED